MRHQSIPAPYVGPPASLDVGPSASHSTVESTPVSLLTRILIVNAGVFVAAAVGLALTPATVSAPIALVEAVALVGGLTAMLLINTFLLRRTFEPLRRLTELMGKVEPLTPGTRIPVYTEDAEIVRLTRAFNAMLDRLEGERRDSLRRSVAAQEAERERVARELHDEIGQSLTALLLHLQRVSREAPAQLRPELAVVREAARATLEEVREVARRLRPEVLDDLGLANALAALCQRLSDQSGLSIARHVDPHLPPLSMEVELVVYRIAQEALTNALRHSEASCIEVSLQSDDDRLTLKVRDDGHGLNGSSGSGAGIQGMRERAMMIGGRYDLRTRPEGGTEVRLELDAAPVRST
jgi:two-component system, NarL family, sensor histidine kinase UhpB